MFSQNSPKMFVGVSQSLLVFAGPSQERFFQEDTGKMANDRVLQTCMASRKHINCFPGHLWKSTFSPMPFSDSFVSQQDVRNNLALSSQWLYDISRFPASPNLSRGPHAQKSPWSLRICFGWVYHFKFPNIKWQRSAKRWSSSAENTDSEIRMLDKLQEATTDWSKWTHFESSGNNRGI